VNPVNHPGEFLPRELFLEVIRAASRVQVHWRTRKRQALLGLQAGGERAWIEMYATNSEDVGWDERRVQPNLTTNPPTQNAITIGHRNCTLRLMAYSLTDALEASDLLGRVRFGFNRVAVHDLMKPRAALRWCEKIISLPDTVREGRDCLNATMDIQMSYAVGDDTQDPAVNDYLLGAGTVTGDPQL
jgi:hypothetical protein